MANFYFVSSEADGASNPALLRPRDSLFPTDHPGGDNGRSRAYVGSVTPFGASTAFTRGGQTFAQVAPTEGWVHGLFSISSAVTVFINARSLPVLGLHSATGELMFGLFRYNNDARLFAFDNSFTIPASTVNDPPSPLPTGLEVLSASGFAGAIDIHYRIAATGGFVDFYVDGSLVVSMDGNSGDTRPPSGAVGPASLALAQFNTSSGELFCTELIVSDEDTRGLRVFTRTMTQSGTNTFSRDPATELTFVASTDPEDQNYPRNPGIYADADGETFQATIPDTAFTDSIVEALFVSVTAGITGGGTVTKLEGLVDDGVTTATSAQVTITDFDAVQNLLRFDTNPLTGERWVAGDFGALGTKIGFRART